ncbi:hypothetical protein [Paraburkholderia diazotrophica]|uniref:hypothetical protein n=1 Tax=Paraburkholderia diazotrophica TaxID=667676 RepID=UPI00317A657B
MAVMHGKLLESAGLSQVPILTARRGIYFLMKRGQIQYIGNTEDIYRRLAQHINIKEFDDVMFLPTDLHPLQAYEDACIRIFKPPLNHDRDKRPLNIDVIMLRHLIPHYRYSQTYDRLRKLVEANHPGNAVKFPGKCG